MCDDFEYALGALKKSDVQSKWMGNNNVIQDATCPFSSSTPTATDITVVSSPVRSGSKAVKFDVDTCNTCMRSNKWRTEIKSASGQLNMDTNYWVGFSMFIPTSFVNDGKSEIIMQIHAPGHKFNIHTNGNNLRTDVHRPSSVQSITHSRGIVRGKWLDFKCNFRLSSSSNGYVRFYRRDEGETNYTQVVNYSGQVGKASEGAYLKLGIYKWSWGNVNNYQSGNNPNCGATIGSGVTHRTLYFDAVKIATTESAVEPVPFGNTPAVPTSLSATAASSSQINLAWTDNSSNETGFEIDRKTGSGGTYSQIATTGANATSYNNSGLSASTQYYYRARATNANGDSANSNEANATTSGGGGGGSNTITVRARAEGSTGGGLQLRIDDVTVQSWTLNSTSYQNFTYNTSSSSGNVKVYFDDSAGDASIDYVQTNGTTYQAESQSSNTAVWQNGSCGGGSNSELMHCSGYINFGTLSFGSGGGGSNTVTVRARGSNGTESISLDIAGTVVATWNLTTSYQNFTYNTTLSSGGLRVNGINLGGSATAYIDYVQAGGTTHQGEAQATNTGVWQNNSCGGSFAENISCDGYINFGNLTF